MKRPLLVTGSHRSGTTWTGRMLALSGELAYMHEPFNPARSPGWTGGRIPLWFLHVGPHNEARYAPIVDDVMAFRYRYVRNLVRIRSPKSAWVHVNDAALAARYRVRPRRPLLKDPIALFSAEWLADRFAADVVVMIRHPAAFVSSIKRLDWRFGFRGWVRQPELMEGLLAPFAADIRRCHDGAPDIIDQGIVMWNAMHHAIDLYRQRRPAWSFVRHEDLAADPIAGFRALYRRNGLTWSDHVRRGIERHSASDNPAEVGLRRHGSVKRDSKAAATAWRARLSGEEVERVLHGTREVASRFYPEGAPTS